jgi:hypothetical protein
VQHPISKPRAYEHSFAKEVMPSLDPMQLEERDCVARPRRRRDAA